MEKIGRFLIVVCFIILMGCGTKDQDGNSFKTIQIGEQIWMAANLNVEHYRNGDPIPEVRDQNEWVNLRTGAWCYYDNDPSNGKKYGKLYNWYAVNDSRGLAPIGWHIPTDQEYETLNAFARKNDATAVIIENDYRGTNTTGFSALIAGMRDGNGDFDLFNDVSPFWSSTEHDTETAYDVNLNLNSRFNIARGYKKIGLYVRCLKD